MTSITNSFDGWARSSMPAHCPISRNTPIEVCDVCSRGFRTDTVINLLIKFREPTACLGGVESLIGHRLLTRALILQWTD